MGVGGVCVYSSLEFLPPALNLSAPGTGEDTCPFTTMCGNILDPHHDRSANNIRVKFQVKNQKRKSEDGLREIRKRADHIRERIDSEERL